MKNFLIGLITGAMMLMAPLTAQADYNISGDLFQDTESCINQEYVNEYVLGDAVVGDTVGIVFADPDVIAKIKANLAIEYETTVDSFNFDRIEVYSMTFEGEMGTEMFVVLYSQGCVIAMFADSLDHILGLVK